MLGGNTQTLGTTPLGDQVLSVTRQEKLQMPGEFQCAKPLYGADVLQGKPVVVEAIIVFCPTHDRPKVRGRNRNQLAEVLAASTPQPLPANLR